MDEQFVRRVHRHAGELGADLSTLPRMHVALAALLLEDQLATGGVAACSDHGQDLIDHLLTVGIRQAATSCEDFFCAVADGTIGVVCELDAFHDRDVTEADHALFQSLHELCSPCAVGQHRSHCRLADLRRERSEPVKDGRRCLHCC